MRQMLPADLRGFGFQLSALDNYYVVPMKCSQALWLHSDIKMHMNFGTRLLSLGLESAPNKLFFLGSKSGSKIISSIRFPSSKKFFQKGLNRSGIILLFR